MEAKRWQEIKRIYESALELAPESRGAFLDERCAGDESLRQQVESFLECRPAAEEFMKSPVFKMAAPDPVGLNEPRTDLTGSTLLHYSVTRKIGEGGMGEVYQADDLKLNRQVALKILPDSFADDPERLARFDREAKLLASLNHQNIAAIYGLEEAEGKRFLVLELVEGDTLAQRIAKGPLPVDEALDVCRQIAEGLEAAHEKGIIHRDLKPANVQITLGGKVKILDFGLAKAFQEESATADLTHSPTITEAMTRAGVILGTAAYMSPEQASGKPVDRRTDIWSFGVVLWELLTGHRLFESETLSHALADVLRGPIGFDKLPRETPAAIRVLLRRCLDRNMKNRLRDIGEARIAIEATLAGETPLFEGAPEPVGARRPWLAWSVAAVLAVGLATIAFLHFREKPPAPAAPVRFQIPAPENLTQPQLSPDGRKLAFAGRDRLWVHFLDSEESRDLTACTTGGYPFWSPDSRFIGYSSQEKLMTIEATGGPPQPVADLRGILWGGAPGTRTM